MNFSSKLLLAAILFFWRTLPVWAQEYKTGEIEFNGARYPAYIKEVDASTDQVSNAVVEIMNARGAKGKEYKGYLIYRKVVLPATGNKEPHDLFVKVDPVGKKSNNRSRISMIITKPDAILEEKPGKNDRNAAMPVALAAGGAALFNEVTPAVENQVYLRNVLNQETEVKKTEKRLRDLQDDQAKLERQLTKLQEEMEKNRNAIAEQLKQVESAKAELEKVKSAKPN